MSLELLRSVDILFWGLLFSAIPILVWGLYSLWKIPNARGLILLRISLFTLLIIGLLQPRFTQQSQKSSTLKWNVYLDNSMSMEYHQMHSLAALNAGIGSTIQRIINNNVQLDYFHFAGEVTPISAGEPLKANGASTDLGCVLSHALEEEQKGLAGIILFTDGQPTQGADPISISSELKIPVFVVGVGDTTPLVDVSIQSIDVPTVTIKGEDVEVKVVITAAGTLNKRLNVTLFKDRKMIGSRFVRIIGDGAQSKVRFRFKPVNLGRTQYRVQVSSLEEEINIKNNQQSFYITILKDRYLVAMFTGTPNFNTPVLKRTLRNLPRVKLEHFVQIGKTVHPAIKSFWETPYDLIVFDNYPTRILSAQWQRFFAKKLVSQKSSLAWIIGVNVTKQSAESLFPFFHVKAMGEILEKRQIYSWAFTGKLADLNLLTSQSPILVLDHSEMPPLTIGLQLEASSEDVWSVANFSSSIDIPVLLLGEKESLRTMVWTTPDLHSLHYKLTGTKQSEFVSQLLSTLASWLMRTSGDNELYFRLDKESYQQGELITVMGNRIGDYFPFSQVAISVFRENTIVNEIELRYNADWMRWEGQLWASIPGEYSYEIIYTDGIANVSQKGSFQVKESQIELNRVFVNTGLLKKIVKITRGRYYPWASRAELVEQIQPKSVSETMISRFTITEEWWMLVLFISILMVEWIWRRRLGLS